jgi:GT2 family glycosyltransferase
MLGGLHMSVAERFSIVVPTRARDELLVRCLSGLLPSVQGIAAQIIVTDDGDGETTREMLRRSFPGVTWTRGPRRGPAANRNHGATLASGQFILFIDDDVVPSAGLLAAYESAVIDGADVYEGKTTCVAGLHSPLEIAPINETGGWLWSCNMMVRRSFWNDFGGFDEAFRFPHMEDVAFRRRLETKGVAMTFVPGAVVDHPPRRLAPAAKRILVHESHFIYHYKYLNQSPSAVRFVTNHVRYFTRVIAKRPKGPDSLLAIGTMVLELGGVLRRWHSWDQQYRGLMRSTAGANDVAVEKT